MSADRPVPAWRAVVFVGLFAYVTVGPAWVQILGRKPTVVRPWQMFTGRGLDATRVVFTRRDASGSFVPLDRFAVLAPRGGEAADALRFVRTPAQATTIAKQLRERLGPDGEVHVRLDTATHDGWRVALDRTFGPGPDPRDAP